MLAYYSVAADREFWSEHWGGHSLDELLALARRSPLTELITRALPHGARVLEGGCGLGQYVLLLRERGWPAVGVDWSVEALAACRRAAPAPLAAMELTRLALRDGAVAAYVSLGVVEHDAAGPDAILAEARRVLAGGGTLVISVPYVNGVRRLGAPWIRRRARALAASGGAFYQYAFSRRELLAALARHGFTPLAAHPYDPARVIRGALPRALTAMLPAAVMAPSAGRPASVSPAGAAAGPVAARADARRRGRAGGWLRNTLRRALYTEPALRLFGHMLLVVARRT
jgi:SAM-dependent methyltransferase